MSRAIATTTLEVAKVRCWTDSFIRAVITGSIIAGITDFRFTGENVVSWSTIMDVACKNTHEGYTVDKLKLRGIDYDDVRAIIEVHDYEYWLEAFKDGKATTEGNYDKLMMNWREYANIPERDLTRSDWDNYQDQPRNMCYKSLLDYIENLSKEDRETLERLSNTKTRPVLPKKKPGSFKIPLDIYSL